MIDLYSFHARICSTAGGFLIQHGRVLLVKHKKLGIWLAPGGHVEDGELPHQTAEREVFEETHVKVKAVSSIPLINSAESEYLPIPLCINLHWISPDNYRARMQSADPSQPHQTQRWPKGCEQHLGYMYLVQAIDMPSIRHDPVESDGIDWFAPDQVDTLETKEDVKTEIKLAFTVSQQIFNQSGDR